MSNRTINFTVDGARVAQMNGLKKRLSSIDYNELCYAVMDFIAPRSCLVHILEYEK
jgi:hypothetical protein